MEITVMSVVEVAAVAAFAYEGANVARRRGMDVVGVATLAVANGLAGGIARDVLIGRPVLALHDARLLGTCFVAALLVCLGAVVSERVVDVVDAIGLGLFTVLGVQRALDAGVTDMGAVMLGAVTVGAGSVVRDLLAGERPTMLYQSEWYVIVSVFGGLLYVLGRRVDIARTPLLFVVAGVAFALRLTAKLRGWRSPVPRSI